MTWSLLIPLVGWSFLGNLGCASIVRGKHQEIVLDLRPAGTVATYEGREVESGDKIMIIKHSEPPSIHFDGQPHAYEHNLEFDMSPWLIADCALLLAGILPGVIALVIDIGNGTWRDLQSPQTIYVPLAEIEAE